MAATYRILDGSKFGPLTHVGLNGTFYNLADETAFTPATGLLDILDRAEVAYERIYTQGSATGEITITGVDTRYPLMINGTLSYVSGTFTPSSAQLAAIQNSNIPYELVYADAELADLTLVPDDVDEDAVVTTVVGAITGSVSGSTVTLTDDAGGLFDKSSLNIRVAGALDFETAESHDIEITETNDAYSNSPHISPITITVNNVTEEEAETTALVARMSPAPDATRRGHIDDLIAALKTAGVWSKLDCLYVMAAHDAQAARLNWKSTSYDATVSGDPPTFTTDRGYLGSTGAPQHLTTGYDPTAGGLNFVQNSAHLGVYTLTGAGGAAYDIDGNSRARLKVANSGNLGNINDADGNSGVGGDAPIHVVLTRRGSSSAFVLENGVSGADQATDSVAPIGFAFRLCGSASAGSGRQMAAAHWGSQLSNVETLAAYNAFNTYLTAVGAI